MPIISCGATSRSRAGRRVGLASVVLLALAARPALAQATNQIISVSPGSAAPGTTNLLVTFTLDTDPPPAPPAGVTPTSVTIGTLTGRSSSHPSQYVVTSIFDIPVDETPGAKDCAVVFSTPNGPVTFSKTGGFEVTAPPGTPPVITTHPQSQIASVGDPASFFVAAYGTAPLSYQWQESGSDLPGATSETYTIVSVAEADAGDYRCVVSNDYGAAVSDVAVLTVDTSVQVAKARYPVVDTAQASCYDASTQTPCPVSGQSYYGQDAQFDGYRPRFVKSADGLTVFDRNSGLTWQHSPDTNASGSITASDKMTWSQAQARPAALNAANYGGFSDWRLPAIKELYSLIDFRGVDPSPEATDTSGLTPFIDRTYFDFAYGAVVARTFDAGIHEITLTVTDAAGLVTERSETLSIAASAPPPVADGKIAGSAATFSKSATMPGWIDVVYDAGSCSSQKAIVLYGDLGDFSTYQGCASDDAGGSGSAAFDATSLGDVWFNVVWTRDATAGHPGFAFDGTMDIERAWTAAGHCGVVEDDPGRDSCP